MKALELPPTLRTATLDEIPNTLENREWLLKRERAKIVQGYTYQPKPKPESIFDFYCEINIDNSKLWELFGVLLFTLPDEISFIYHHIDSDTTFSPYLNKLDIINTVSKYATELTQDGLLEFGAIYQSDTELIEVFVKKSKFIQYWGRNFVIFKNIMLEFGLEEIEDLNFLDEFPLVTTPLRLHDLTVLDTEELITTLNSEW